MHIRTLAAGALCAAIAFGAAAPALADGAASTRNIFVAGVAAAIGLTNWNHKTANQTARDARARTSPISVSRVVLQEVRPLSVRSRISRLVRKDVRRSSLVRNP